LLHESAIAFASDVFAVKYVFAFGGDVFAR